MRVAGLGFPSVSFASYGRILEPAAERALAPVTTLEAAPDLNASRLHGPGPADEMYNQRKQKRIAGAP
jgi:hypothetical protein